MTIEDRLLRLERHNWRLRTGLIMVVLAGLALFTIGATGGARDAVFGRIVAKEILVVQANGKLGIGLISDPRIGGAIVTYNPQGKSLIDIGANDFGSSAIRIYGRKGKDAVIIGATEDGSGVISTYDEDGKELIRISADKTTGEGMIGAFNRAGKAGAAWPKP